MEKKTRILVLDDEPIVGERLKASLERAGFAVDAYVSSSEAIRRLGKEHYDILITDLKMSGPDGLEVLKQARQLCSKIKSVVITGFATSEIAEEAMQSGAVVFLAKPFKLSYLKSVLTELSRAEDDSSK